MALKLISTRIDEELSISLKKHCESSGIKINHFIEEAIKLKLFMKSDANDAAVSEKIKYKKLARQALKLVGKYKTNYRDLSINHDKHILD